MPILTGLSSEVLRTHLSSHRISVGQTRAHMPPRMFSSRIFSAAPSVLPVLIMRMKLGMSIEVGHASMQGASWQK